MTDPTPVEATPIDSDEARSALHTALEDVEAAFQNLYGKVSSKVAALLSHLHGQAESLTDEAETDAKEDASEVAADVKTITVTGQSALGGGVNPNAVHPTSPPANVPVQTETQQVVPPVQG